MPTIDQHGYDNYTEEEARQQDGFKYMVKTLEAEHRQHEMAEFVASELEFIGYYEFFVDSGLGRQRSLRFRFRDEEWYVWSVSGQPGIDAYQP